MYQQATDFVARRPCLGTSSLETASYSTRATSLLPAATDLSTPVSPPSNRKPRTCTCICVCGRTWVAELIVVFFSPPSISPPSPSHVTAAGAAHHLRSPNPSEKRLCVPSPPCTYVCVGGSGRQEDHDTLEELLVPRKRRRRKARSRVRDPEGAEFCLGQEERQVDRGFESEEEQDFFRGRGEMADSSKHINSLLPFYLYLHSNIIQNLNRWKELTSAKTDLLCK